MANWTITQELEKAYLTQVFSGGACNILDEEGNLLRNSERDAINDWLSEQNILFFDPQVHPETHGVEYEFEKHAALEIAARAAAKLNLYEISPRTFGGITSLEIAADHFQWHEPMVIYYSDGSDGVDRVPDYSKYGHPLFVPYGIHSSEKADLAHYQEMQKNANNMRKYLLHFATQMKTLTVTFADTHYPGEIVITPDRMHAAEIFEAVVKAASGKRVYVHFPPKRTARDSAGNPLFVCPERPPKRELYALLDQYIDEGNDLRKRIAELVCVNVFVRIVYTQSSAKLALDELLTIMRKLNKL